MTEPTTMTSMWGHFDEIVAAVGATTITLRLSYGRNKMTLFFDSVPEMQSFAAAIGRAVDNMQVSNW